MDRGLSAQIRVSTGATVRIKLYEAAPFSRSSYHANMWWPRRGCSPSHAYPGGMQSQAQVQAIPWDEAYVSEWKSETAEPQTPLQQQRQFAITQRTSKPLKINIDLLLYRARIARQKAFHLPTAAMRSEAMRTAEVCLRKCLVLDASDGRPYVSLGKLLVQQKRFDEARKLYEDGAAVTGGSNPFIWASWAFLEAKLGKVARARQLYDASVVAEPSHAAAWHGWGLLEKKEGNVLRARDLWLKGVKATAENPNPYLYQSLAVLAAEMGLVEESRKWFMKGTRTLVGQASHALWQAWALMEGAQGDSSAVRYLFKRGLDVGPRSRYLYLAWATWEEKQGKRTFARRLLERGHQLNRRDPAILQAWALLEQEDGNKDEARRLFQLGADMDSSHTYIWQAWGVFEFRDGNLDKARELFQQGVWADPSSTDVARVFQAWAVLEQQAGNSSLARELFRCAVKADPKSEPSWQSWAQLEEELGAFQRADELRNFRQQSRTEVVMPRTFADPDQIFEPILKQIATWFTRFEATRPESRSRQRSPRWLAPDGSDIRSDTSAMGASSTTPSGETKFSGLAGMLAAKERDEMLQLNNADELELPVLGQWSRKRVDAGNK